MLSLEGRSSRTMPTAVALFLSAMPGLAIMSLVICAPMKSATAKAAASPQVTKKKEKATGGKDKKSLRDLRRT